MKAMIMLILTIPMMTIKRKSINSKIYSYESYMKALRDMLITKLAHKPSSEQNFVTSTLTHTHIFYVKFFINDLTTTASCHIIRDFSITNYSLHSHGDSVLSYVQLMLTY